MKCEITTCQSADGLPKYRAISPKEIAMTAVFSYHQNLGLGMVVGSRTHPPDTRQPPPCIVNSNPPRIVNHPCYASVCHDARGRTQALRFRRNEGLEQKKTSVIIYVELGVVDPPVHRRNAVCLEFAIHHHSVPYVKFTFSVSC